MGLHLLIGILGLLSLSTFSNGNALVTTILIQNNGTNATATTPEIGIIVPLNPGVTLLDEQDKYGDFAECGDILTLREGQMYQFRSKSSYRSRRSPYWYPFQNQPQPQFQHYGSQQPRHYPVYPYHYQHHPYAPMFQRQPSRFLPPPLKPSVCRWAFVTETNCDLVVNFDVYEVGDPNCNNQYLLIGDEDRDIQVCGYTQFPGYFRSQGMQLFIKHFKRPGAWGAEFEGYVSCVKKYPTQPEPETAIDVPPTVGDRDEDASLDIKELQEAENYASVEIEIGGIVEDEDSSTITDSTPMDDTYSLSTPAPNVYHDENPEVNGYIESGATPDNSMDEESPGVPENYPYEPTTPAPEYYTPVAPIPSPATYADTDSNDENSNPDAGSYAEEVMPASVVENYPSEYPTPAPEAYQDTASNDVPENFVPAIPASQYSDASTQTDEESYVPSSSTPEKYEVGPGDNIVPNSAAETYPEAVSNVESETYAASNPVTDTDEASVIVPNNYVPSNPNPENYVDTSNPAPETYPEITENSESENYVAPNHVPEPYSATTPNLAPESYADSPVSENYESSQSRPVSENYPDPIHAPEYPSSGSTIDESYNPEKIDPDMMLDSSEPEKHHSGVHSNSNLGEDAAASYPENEPVEIDPRAHKPYARTSARAYTDDENSEASGSGSGSEYSYLYK